MLSGDVTIWLKGYQMFLNKEWMMCPVSHFNANHVGIIEIDGHCYAAIPCDKGTLTGLLFETRDSFDDLVAQYQGKEIAGGNASETKE